MAAAERLQVGAVGEGDLDLDEHVARPRLRARERPRGEDRRARGSAALSRREDDLQRAAGAVELEALGETLERQRRRLRQVELGQKLERSRMCRGVAEREPVSVSSLR